MTREGLPEPRIPVTTYRLQFNRHFRFQDAKRIIPYLFALGISDLYASPYFKAREGSLHGYDIVDHNPLTPEIGTEEEYNEMTEEPRKYGMGQILDIVPNHMCIASKENLWWMDLLENGPSSIYADFFDIDWDPVKRELRNKILIPILGDQYGNVLENQDLRLTFQEGAFFVCYYEYRFPIIPKTYIDILQHRIKYLEGLLSPEDPHFIELLSIMTALNYLPPCTETRKEKIDERYRDAFWRVATEEINYRRFFDINELGAIRMENPGIFEETHRMIFRLIREGKVTGLRVDHPDGLYNPLEYFQWLQWHCFVRIYTGGAGLPSRESTADIPEKRYGGGLKTGSHYQPFYVVGEKILTRGERMPEDWPIFSTTGYVFLNTLNGVFIDTAQAKAFDEIYARFIKTKLNFADVVYLKKKLIMKVAMSCEVNTLGYYLDRISEKNRHTRDFTLNSLIAVITEVVALFPVYRTYITAAGITDRDRRYIEIAVSRAKRKNPAVSESVFDFLKAILLLNYPADLTENDRREWLA